MPVKIIGRKQIVLLSQMASGRYVLGNLNTGAARYFGVDRGWYLIAQPVSKQSVLIRCLSATCGALVSGGFVKRSSKILPSAFQCFELSTSGVQESAGLIGSE